MNPENSPLPQQEPIEPQPETQTAQVKRPMNPKYQNLFGMDASEQFISEIRKHPIGALFIYITGIGISAVIIFITVVAAAFLPKIVHTQLGLARLLLVGLGLLIAGLALAMMFVSAYIYHSSVLLLTNEKLIEVHYTSLFNRTVTQASLGEIQDVTVQQVGLFPRIFNYGLLIIETAGEKHNFTFEYTPNPNVFSREITEAHEADIHRYGN